MTKLRAWKAFSVWMVLMLVAALGAAIVPASPVEADAYWYVDGALGTDDGSHGQGPGAEAWKTIQYAINDGGVTGGDTINVAAGTYNENVDVNKSVILIGAGAGSTIVQAAATNDHVFSITQPNVTVTGFTLTGATDFGMCGIFVDGVCLASSCTISSDNVSNNTLGIYLYQSSNNTLTNNTANSNNMYYGILLDSSSNNTLTNNTANSNNTGGIVLSNSSSNNTLTGNTANSNNLFGIDLDSSSNNTLTNNTASNNDYGINLYSSSNNTLTNNTANSNNPYGIRLYSSSNSNTLTNNATDNNGSIGIYLNTSHGNTFRGNFSRNNHGNGWGFHLYNSNDNTLEDNQVYDNLAEGIYLQGCSGCRIGPGNVVHDNDMVHAGIYFHQCSDIQVSNNEVYNEAYGIYLAASDNNTILNNSIHDNGHGIWIDSGSIDHSDNNQILGNSIVNNNKMVNSGIHLTLGASGTVIHFNIIVGNNPMTGNHGVFNENASEMVDATNNWWGANDGPSASPGSGDKVSAYVDADPWLVIGVSANPASIVVGGVANSTITADMTKNSDGVDTSAQGHIPDGTQIIFTTDKGSIGSLTVDKTTTNGKATATLTSSNTVETATVCAEAPHGAGVPEAQYKVCTTVDFVAGTSQSVQTATGTGTATFSSDIGQIENLTAVPEAAAVCTGKPAGVTFPHGLFSFNITNIAPGSTVTVTITLPSPVPIGTQYWKCQNGPWINCTSLLGDDDGDNVLTLTLTDGGLGDADGAANGTIVDPGGPAVPVVLSPAPAPAGPRASPPMPAPPRVLRPAQLSVQYLSVNPQQTSAGQTVTITTNVVNTGDEGGNYYLALKINGQVEQTKMVSVGPQGTQPVKFTVAKAQPGTYTVDIVGQRGSFIVLGTGGTAGVPVNGGLIAILIMGVLILTTVVVLLVTFRRRAY